MWLCGDHIYADPTEPEPPCPAPDWNGRHCWHDWPPVIGGHKRCCHGCTYIKKESGEVTVIDENQMDQIIEERATEVASDQHRQFLNAVSEVYEGAQDLLIRKHRDYGPKNIADAPGGALNGLQVRMHDKLARISNLLGQYGGLETEPGLPANESLRDSFLDLANYAMIGVLVIDGDWPE